MERVQVGILALLAALSFGLTYGVVNQTTYLLQPLHQLDPSFLRSDWLTTETTFYHPTFTAVVEVLAHIGPLPWMLAIVNLGTIAVSVLLLYHLVDAVAPPAARLVVTVALAALVVAGQTESTGGSYLFSGYLQPSSLAVPAFLAAALAFVQGRWLMSGILMALAGVFHANFLLLGLLVFSLAHPLIGWDRTLPRRLVAQIVPGLLALILHAPIMIEMAGSSAGPEASRIFHTIRSPHHYMPRYFWKSLLPFGGWLLAGIGVQVSSLRPGPTLSATRFRALFGVMAASVVMVTALLLVAYVPFLTQLYFWRLAPFLVLASQLSLCVLVWDQYFPDLGSVDRRPPTTRDIVGRAIAAAGLALVLSYHVLRWALRNNALSPIVWPTAALLALLVLPALLRRRGTPMDRADVSPQAPKRTRSAAWAWCAFLLVAAMRVVPAYPHWNLVIPPAPSAERELYAWAATTDIDAQFVIPPELEEFRLRSGRAVVADWKSTPILPDELLDWYARMVAISGGTVTGVEDATDSYLRMTAARLASLAEDYGATHAVLELGDAGDESSAMSEITGRYPVVFRNQKFIVVAISRGDVLQSLYRRSSRYLASIASPSAFQS